jgi:hypothetical protein
LITPPYRNWRRAAQRLALAVVLATATIAAGAQTWRCEAPSGVVYADRPCPTGSVEQRKVDAGIQVIPATPGSSASGQRSRPLRSRVASQPGAAAVGVPAPKAKPVAATSTTDKARPKATVKPKPKRDPWARAAFRRLKPCPATGQKKGACPGYEIDHVVPLAAGGADAPHNMQWLTRKQHREKTRRERQACVYGCRP